MTITTIPRSPRRLSGLQWTLERVSDPVSEPIDIVDMKKHLRAFEETTGEEDGIEEQFFAAREWVEDYTARALVDQVWRLTIDNQNGHFFSSCNGVAYSTSFSSYGAIQEIMLRRSPVIAINSFVSVDAAGTETAIDSAAYALVDKDSKWPRIAIVNGGIWTGGTFKIEFRAGYVDASGDPIVNPIPRRLLQAMKLYAEALYDRDPQMMPILMKAAEDMIKRERIEMGMA